MYKIDYLLFAVLSDVSEVDLGEKNEVWFTRTSTRMIFLRDTKGKIGRSQADL